MNGTISKSQQSAIIVIGQFMPACKDHYSAIMEAAKYQKEFKIDNIFIGIVSSDSDILSAEDRKSILENSGNSNIASRCNYFTKSSKSEIISHLAENKIRVAAIIDLIKDHYIPEKAICKQLSEGTLPIEAARLGFYEEFVDITMLHKNQPLAKRIYAKLRGEK